MVGKRIAAAVAACLGLMAAVPGTATAAPARGDDAARATAAFPVDPAATAPPVTGRARRMLAAGAPVTTLVPVRFAPEAGTGTAEASRRRSWCGVMLRGPDGREQSLVTVGTAWTGLLDCEGLVEAGPLRAVRGHPPRIALIYRTSGPAGRAQTPVVLAWDAGSGRWSPEETASIMLGGRRDAGRVSCISRILAAS